MLAYSQWLIGNATNFTESSTDEKEAKCRLVYIKNNSIFLLFFDGSVAQYYEPTNLMRGLFDDLIRCVRVCSSESVENLIKA